MYNEFYCKHVYLLSNYFLSYHIISYPILSIVLTKWGEVREGSMLEIRGGAYYINIKYFPVQLVVTFSLFTCRKVSSNVIFVNRTWEEPRPLWIM